MPNVTPAGERAEQRRKFFYAEADAGLYDVSIDWVVPHYHLMHEVVMDAVKAASERAERAGVPFTVLDVGAGTGTDSLRILAEFPSANVVAMDVCEPMLARMRAKLDALPNAAGMAERLHLVHADVLDGFGSRGDLVALLPRHLQEGGYSLILSSLTVHHFEHAQKQAWLELSASSLSDHGMLVMADLFSYADTSLAARSLEYDLSWMHKHFLGMKSEQLLSAEDRRRLLASWRAHYENDNRLEPLESAGDQPGHIAMMRRAGLANVSVPYRFGLSGVIVARK